MSIKEQLRDLKKISSGFRESRILLTSNNLGLFEYLKEKMDAESLSKVLGTDKRAIEILLDALCAMKLLKKDSNCNYINTPLTMRLLVKNSPYYQGDILKHMDTLWKNWSNLDEILKTGRPYHSSRDHESFIKGMHNIAIMKVKDVVYAMDLKNVKRLLDLGGGPGTYSIEFAKHSIDITLFDYPETIKIARNFINASGLKNIRTIEGDFLIDDIGHGYDLVFISQVLHAYSQKDNAIMLRKSFNALNKNGSIVIHEFYISKDRTKPLNSALFSVNMLVNTEGGRCYAPEEIILWLKNTGFKGIKKRLLEDTILITGKKN